jgi:hypothetical protein
MIPFFRKIRKKMADDNKPLKYMRYAVGEIVLVVIGILIALQINTWNEERKNNAKILSFFEEVQKDLLKDISNTEDAISAYKMKDSLAYLVLNNKITRDDYKTSDHRSELFQLIVNSNPFIFNTNGYHNLKLNVNDISSANKAVYDTLTRLYNYLPKILEDQNIRINNYVYDNIKYLSNNKKWFSSEYSTWQSNDTIIDYFLYDPFYKNRVKEFRILLSDPYKTYKIEAIKVYEQLDVITKSKKPIPNHLKIYIVDADSLKQYIGVYKPKDSTQKNLIEVNEKGFFYNKYKYNLLREGNDRFSFEDSYNRSLTFQSNTQGEFNGLTIHLYDKNTEYIKTD